MSTNNFKWTLGDNLKFIKIADKNFDTGKALFKIDGP